MIVIAATDDPKLKSIAECSTEQYPYVFGAIHKIFDGVPALNKHENLFIIAHGAYNGDEGEPVIGDKRGPFYLDARDVYHNLKLIFPGDYMGNVYVDACQSADHGATTSFIERLKSSLEHYGQIGSLVFGKSGASSGYIEPPGSSKWVQAK